MKKVVEETGYGPTLYGALNMSDIWSVLIKEAAKCRSHASDLLFDYERIISIIDEGETKVDAFFGFRDVGVDHGGYISANDAEGYRSIYRLTISGGDVENRDGYRAWSAVLKKISPEEFRREWAL